MGCYFLKFWPSSAFIPFTNIKSLIDIGNGTILLKLLNSSTFSTTPKIKQKLSLIKLKLVEGGEGVGCLVKDPF